MGNTPEFSFPYPDPSSVPDMAYWGQQLAEAVETQMQVFHDPQFFRVYRAAALNVGSDNTWLNVGWDTKTAGTDVGNNFTLTTNGGYWTAPRNGLVRFSGRMAMTSPTVPTGSAVSFFVGLWESSNAGSTWPTELIRGDGDLNMFVAGANWLKAASFGTEVNVVAGRAYAGRMYGGAPAAAKAIEVGSQSAYFSGAYVN